MRRVLPCVVICFLMCADGIMARQAPLTFEVASLKPTVSSAGVSGGCRGIDSRLAPSDPRNNIPLGRCVFTAGRLSHLMSAAFGFPLRRIKGFPDWDGPNRFDLEGKAEDPSTTTEQQLISMLQAFMTERFKLTLRRETSEGPIFALTVGKNGPKNIKASDQAGESMAPSGAGLIFKGYTMQRLAEFLSMLPAVDRPVRNTTPLNGRFDFSLNVFESKPEDIAGVKMAIGTWDSIFSDLQNQLVLRLESAKGPIETLVIDHAEKPELENNY